MELLKDRPEEITNNSILAWRSCLEFSEISADSFEHSRIVYFSYDEDPYKSNSIEDAAPLHLVKLVIKELPKPYTLKQPIPISIECIEPGSYVASFKEANISMTGRDENDARRELALALIDFLEVFSDDSNFKDIIDVLRLYIQN